MVRVTHKVIGNVNVRSVASYLLKVANFSTPRVFVAPVGDGVTPSKFYQYRWHQKTRVPGHTKRHCVRWYA